MRTRDRGFGVRSMLGFGLSIGICGVLLATALFATAGVATVGSVRAAGPATEAVQSASGASAATEYPVTAFESGLVVGADYDVVWSIQIAGGLSYSTASGFLNFYLPNGSYQFTASSSDVLMGSPGGAFVVSGGPVSTYAQFVPVNFTVTFMETGLPAGTPWTVSFDSIRENSTTDTLSFEQVNGTYDYAVAVLSAYFAVPATGSVTIDGGPVSAAIAFGAATPGLYTLSFAAAALPSNATWSVVVNGATQNAVGPDLALREQNGTYSFTVNAPAGYLASPVAGQVSIVGASAQQTIDFIAIPSSSGSNVSPYVYIFGSFAVTGGLIAASVGVWAWKRSRRPPQGFD